jgi:adenylate cyclase
VRHHGTDADDQQKLTSYATELGATPEQIARASSLGELALDLHLRPQPVATIAAVVADLGVDWAYAERLITALGFPRDRDQLVTAAEADALRLLVEASRDLFGVEATVQVARVVGNAMARLAEVLVASFRLQYELPRRREGVGNFEVVREYSDIAEHLLPEFVSTLDALLRRQIVAVTKRMWSTDDEQSAVTLPRAVGFVDLVGYTEASAAMSVSELSSMLAEFDERAANVVAHGNGQIVKTIGDEAMFVTESALDSCRIALDLVESFGHGRLPPVRVGLASGEVLSVSGDVYGPDVNLAARLVAAAEPSTVVVSERIHADAGDRFRFDPLAPLTLKGLAGPVTAYRLRS